MPDAASPPTPNEAATSTGGFVTLIKWVAIVGVTAITAQALRLSAPPIMEFAKSIGVPDDGSLTAAAMVIEGAVLVMTVMWLHPGFAPERNWSRVIAICGLVLSGTCAYIAYGPPGIVASCAYAGCVHVLSKVLLRLARERARDKWGGPETVTATSERVVAQPDTTELPAVPLTAPAITAGVSPRRQLAPNVTTPLRRQPRPVPTPTEKPSNRDDEQTHPPERRRCGNTACGRLLPPGSRIDRKFCDATCRQAGARAASRDKAEATA